MIISALISQCRREFFDVPESSEALRGGDGSSVLFNLGRKPIVENSYSVYKGTSAQTETTHYTLDKDSGDLQFSVAPANGINARATFKYAYFRDTNWVEAINYGIDALNGLGFFKNIVRNNSLLRLSANVRTYSGPSNCIDIYEFLLFDNRTVSGSTYKPGVNWRYEAGENKLVLGNLPAVAEPATISYLRNMVGYSATSATIDVLDDWLELVKKKAGAYFFRNVASRIALQGAATIEEGHFSFTNARTMANDLENDFERLAQRKKPVRPSRDIKFHLEDGGVA